MRSMPRPPSPSIWKSCGSFQRALRNPVAARAHRRGASPSGLGFAEAQLGPPWLNTHVIEALRRSHV